jgi:FKBP-type peptidyl-prolyl cis-trans isomerase FklB
MKTPPSWRPAAGLLLGLALLAPVQAQNASSGGSMPEIYSRQEMTSYAMGVSTARDLMREGIEFNPEMMARGLRDGLAGSGLLLDEREMRTLMQAFLSETRQRVATNRTAAAERNRKAGEEFLAANARKEGIVSLPGGLQYRVLKAGSGPKPGEADSVVVHYRGTSLGGKEFDATPEGRPATLKIKQLITGWRQALAQMPVGSRWQIFIPPSLAYGPRGMGGDIGPEEVIQFDVELEAIKP